MKSTLVIAALVVTALGASAFSPAIAQDTPAAPSTAPSQPTPPTATAPDTTPRPMHRFARKGGGMGGMNRMDRGGRLLTLACSDKGAVVLERILDRTAKRLDLTATQQSLFDTFRTKALVTASSFSTQCQAARPDRTKGRPDLIDRLQSGLAIDQARITALNAVLPDFQALFDSLSDQQKAQLRPSLMLGKGGMNKGGMGNNGRPHHWGNRDGNRTNMGASSAT